MGSRRKRSAVYGKWQEGICVSGDLPPEERRRCRDGDDVSEGVRQKVWERNPRSRVGENQQQMAFSGSKALQLYRHSQVANHVAAEAHGSFGGRKSEI